MNLILASLLPPSHYSFRSSGGFEKPPPVPNPAEIALKALNKEDTVGVELLFFKKP